MHTTMTQTLVAAEPAKVYSAVLDLISRLWSVTGDDVIDARPVSRIIHAVRLDGETNCWLAWELSRAGPVMTRVRVAHDDADLRDAPAPDLDSVLDLLTAALDASGPRPAAHGSAEE